MRLLRRRPATDASSGRRFGDVVTTAIGLAAAAYAIALNAATLTRAPEPYGDEAWVGSAVWSLTHGHGLRPAIAAGSGIYDHSWDHWMPRIGIVPQIVADLVAGTSFTAYRAASLVVAIAALAVLWVGARRLWPAGVAALAAAATATTWIFVGASHYIRWDDVTLLCTCSVFALLAWGPPTRARTLGVGLAIGVSPDFSVPTFALLPAALLIIVSRSSANRARAAVTCLGGAAVGVLAYVLMHFATGIGAAKRQYDLTYANAYRLPVLDALEHGSLTPIWRERQRYEAMAGPFADSRTLLLVGIACAVIAIINAARMRDLRRSIGSLLLVSQLAGLALLYANRGPSYAIGAVPFAAVAVVEALSLVPRMTVAAPAVALVAATVIGGRAVTAGVDGSLRGAATNADVSRIARSMVPRGQYAMGDYVYWWLFRNDQFRFNADLWADEYQHHVSLRRAFAAVCPAVVVYDDEWQNRYPANAPGSLGFRFPALAPTDPNEEPKLMRILLRNYRFPPRIVIAGGRTVTFWRRRGRTCT